MMPRLGFTLVSAALVATAAFAVSAPASGHVAVHNPEPVTTPNWSGYVATGRSSDPVAFRRVTGSWLVPAVHCTAADARASSAVWVGLGGYLRAEKNTLEHLGTDSNCDAAGRPVYFAWFEVAPFRAFTIPNRLRAGDAVTATVAVLPDARVELALKDATSGWASARTISLFGQPAASAEWIVSTPENCIQTSCKLARLPEFATVRFSHIDATAASATGTLADPAWHSTPIELAPVHAGSAPTTLASTASDPPTACGEAGATPGPVSPEGGTFSVSWMARVAGTCRSHAGARREMQMSARVFAMASAILAFAAPTATAARGEQIAVEAVMTLRALSSSTWVLDVQNSTLAPVTIRQVTWTAPSGLMVDRIVESRGGTCTPAGGGLQCTTQLAPPSCTRCAGGDLSVRFTGTGRPGRKWVATRSGGFWEIEALRPGHVNLLASADRAPMSSRRART
jgi:hypothetical protein